MVTRAELDQLVLGFVPRRLAALADGVQDVSRRVCSDPLHTPLRRLVLLIGAAQLNVFRQAQVVDLGGLLGLATECVFGGLGHDGYLGSLSWVGCARAIVQRRAFIVGAIVFWAGLARVTALRQSKGLALSDAL